MDKNIKKYINLIIVISISTIVMFLLLYCINETKEIKTKQKAETTTGYNNVNIENISNADTTTNSETTDLSNLIGTIKSRDGSNYTVQLDFTADKCIGNVENLNTNETVENTTEPNHLSLTSTFVGVKNLTYQYKVTMASGATEIKQFKIDDFVPKTNQAPIKPTISAWPEEVSIKKNREVRITATSEDPNNDVFEYVWEGRTAETSTYSIGEHTVRVKAIDLYGAESEWSEYNFTVIDVEAATLTSEISSTGNSNFNIRGNGYQTTYSDVGYSTTLKVLNSEIASNVTSTVNIVNGTGGFSYSSSTGNTIAINLSTKIDMVEDGNYAKITYTVKNNGNVSASVSIATDADIMINNDDTATITRLSNDRGFSMTDGTYNYKVYLKKTTGVTDVDTYWFGQFNSRKDNLWNNCTGDTLTNTDSGMTYSWQNRTIAAGATQEFSVIIGLE